MVVFGDKGVRPPLGCPDTAEHVLDQAPLPLAHGEPTRFGPARGTARDVGVPEGTSHLFNDVVDPVGGRAHVRSVGRYHDGKVVPAAGPATEPDGLQEVGDGRCGQGHPDLSLHAGDGYLDLEGSRHVTVDPEHAVGNLEAGRALTEQLTEAV